MHVFKFLYKFRLSMAEFMQKSSSLHKIETNFAEPVAIVGL